MQRYNRSDPGSGQGLESGTAYAKNPLGTVSHGVKARKMVESLDNALWTAYQDSGDNEAREQLLSKHLGLVHHVARQVLMKSPAHAEFDELVSAGAIGLMNAVENFEPARGLAFSTFAAPRIRGAILDDLRRRDHVPRSTRKRQREMQRAREALMRRLNRSPQNEEIATELGITSETLWSWEQESEQAGWLSLDRPMDSGDGKSMRAVEIIPGSDGTEIEGEINLGEEVLLLREEIEKLNAQERTVLTLYYFEELKLREIAEILGVTESRISQVRWKAIKRLRTSMAHLQEHEGSAA